MAFRPPNKSKTPPPEETFEEAAYLKAKERRRLADLAESGQLATPGVSGPEAPKDEHFAWGR